MKLNQDLTIKTKEAVRDLNNEIKLIDEKDSSSK